MATTEKVLENVEALTTELYGRGAAVSVDEETAFRCVSTGEKRLATVYVRCWDAKGIKVNEVARRSKGDAIRAMLSALRLKRATTDVDVG